MAKDAPPTPAAAEKPKPSPASRRAWGPFWSLRDDVDDLFEDFYRGSLAPWGRSGREFLGRLTAEMPRLDVIDKEDELKISAELPGMEEKDIHVEVADRTLTISGEKKEEFEEGDKEGDHYLSERRYGSFRRSVALPEGLDHDKIDASFAKGVLTVRLPRKPEARKPARKIEVKAGG